MTQQPQGWYPDPSGDSSKIRWWDGSKWTDHVRDVADAAGYTKSNTNYPQWQNLPPATPGYIQPDYQAPPTSSYYTQPGTALAGDKHQSAQAGMICALVGLVLNIIFFLMAGLLQEPSESLVLIFLFAHALTIPAIIFSAVGLKSSKRGMAITGLVLGILGIVAFVVLLIVSVALVNAGLI